jgi:hypothetical protein
MVVVGVGIVLRALASTVGYNYDFASYLIVADIIARGEVVYMATWRYNYGPIWFLVIHAFDQIAAIVPFARELTLRVLVIALLTFADLAIAAALYRRVSPLAALIFFLNPVSVLITGFHNQFDNLALSIGFSAVQLFSRSEARHLDRVKLIALALLGLSLMTKHLFFVLPIWLAFRQAGWFQRGVVVGLPVAIFLSGFAPFWADAQVGILGNVFRYNSGNNSPLYALPIFTALEPLIAPRLFWYGSLLLGAFALRRVELFQAALIYTGLLVALAPAMTNQYLAIPMALVVAQINPGFVIYVALSLWHILADVNGFRLAELGVMPPFDRQVSYAWILAAFWSGLIWMVVVYYRNLRRSARLATQGYPYETKTQSARDRTGA